MPYSKLMDQHSVYMCMYECICEFGKWETLRINKKLHNFTLFHFLESESELVSEEIWIQRESVFHTLVDLNIGD
jgi:hypothetical protein